MRFEQPLALTLLALPIVALLRSLVRGAPRPRLLATVELMPREGDPAAAAPRRRVPLSRALLALALALVTVVLAEPRLAPSSAPPAWTVVVDRSASMGLVAEGAAPRHALAVQMLQGELGSGPHLFVAGDDPTLEVLGDAPPSEWFTGPPRPEPDWNRFDRAGTWWLTDRAPADEPLRAGLVAAGGPAVPGLVSAGPAGALALEAGQLVERPEAARRGTFRLEAGLQAPLVAAVEAWAAARGHEPAEDGAVGSGAVGLWVRAVPPGGEAAPTGGPPGPLDAPASEPARVLEGRGWWLMARGEVRPAPGEPVAYGAGLAAQPGVLWSGLPSRVTLEGDAAAFALAVAAACDRSLWPGPDVVPLDERGEAGERLVRRGAPRTGAERPAPELEVPLLVAAAVLGAGALLAARGGRP